MKIFQMQLAACGLLLTAVLGTPVVAQPFISGIDVSKYQGSINWNSVRNSGVEFAFTKATEGVNFVDARFQQNMSGATAAGVLIGPYHFCRSESLNGSPFTSYDGSPFQPGTSPYIDAVSEANDFLDAILPYYQTGSYLPPVADVERFPDFSTYSLERTFTSNWVQLFSDTVNDALGIRPIIYTGKSAANTYFNSGVGSQHELWEAWWKTSGLSNPPTASDTPVFGDWLFWQWTSTGSVPGISGNVDLDVFEGTRSQLEDLLYTLVPQNNGPFGNVKVIEDFENGAGYFHWSIDYSGSTTGILPGSDTLLTSDHAHDGTASQEIDIIGDSGGWLLRHLTGNASQPASPTTNVPFAPEGYAGFWLMTTDSGVTVQLALDDSTTGGTERSTSQEVIADGAWHLYEWDLADADQWDAWVGGSNGVLNGPTVTVDSIQFSGAGNAVLYLDSLAHNPDGSLLASLGDFDYDGDVDEDDLALWQANAGTTSGASFDRGDADGDGNVDGADFLAWQRTFLPATAAHAEATPVPEPGSALLLIGLLSIIGTAAHRAV